MPAKDAPSQDHSMEGHGLCAVSPCTLLRSPHTFPRLHVSLTLLAAPPGTSIPFECSNGRLRLSVSPHPTGQSSGGIELIDVDLASIGSL
jgi:hypothetical protein